MDIVPTVITVNSLVFKVGVKMAADRACLSFGDAGEVTILNFLSLHPDNFLTSLLKVKERGLSFSDRSDKYEASSWNSGQTF